MIDLNMVITIKDDKSKLKTDTAKKSYANFIYSSLARY